MAEQKFLDSLRHDANASLDIIEDGEWSGGGCGVDFATFLGKVLFSKKKGKDCVKPFFFITVWHSYCNMQEPCRSKASGERDRVTHQTIKLAIGEPGSPTAQSPFSPFPKEGFP